jgi:glycosyltransferase involved in cell wall biosynthesis
MARARGRLGIEPDAAVVGYCGNLDGYQNMDLLLQAMAALRTRNRSRPANLLIVTHVADPGFERAVAAAGLAGVVRVEVADGFSAARRGLEAADVVVLPRRKGSGYPIKLINYMAMAMPIVTAGCGGKILDDGVDALVVGDDDAVALAAAIESLLEDPGRALRLGDGAWRHYMQSLTWEAVLPAIEGVYHEVLTAGARSTAPSTL